MQAVPRILLLALCLLPGTAWTQVAPEPAAEAEPPLPPEVVERRHDPAIHHGLLMSHGETLPARNVSFGLDEGVVIAVGIGLTDRVQLDLGTAWLFPSLSASVKGVLYRSASVTLAVRGTALLASDVSFAGGGAAGVMLDYRVHPQVTLHAQLEAGSLRSRTPPQGEFGMGALGVDVRATEWLKCFAELYALFGAKVEVGRVVISPAAGAGIRSGWGHFALDVGALVSPELSFSPPLVPWLSFRVRF